MGLPIGVPIDNIANIISFCSIVINHVFYVGNIAIIICILREYFHYLFVILCENIAKLFHIIVIVINHVILC